MNSPTHPTDYPYLSQPVEDGSGNDMSIMALLDIIARRWLLIVIITSLSLVAAVGASFLLTPLYKGEAQIKVDPAARTVTDGPARQTSPQADQSRIDTEVDILKSREMAQRVVKKLNLVSDREFRPHSESAVATQAALFESVVTSVMDHLDVTRQSDNYIISIDFRSEDPVKAALIANAFSDTYIASTVEDRTSNAASQADWLRQRLQTLGDEVQSYEQQLATYRARAGIVEGATQGTVADQQVGPVATQLAQAESEAASARADLEAAQAQIKRGQLSAVSSVLNSQTISDLRSQRAQAARELAQIEARYGPRHPEYVRVTQQLKEIDAGLQDEAQRIVDGLAARARATAARAASLRATLNQVRNEQSSNTRAAVQADSIERQVKAKQDAYEQLAGTLQQVTQQQRDLLPTAVIVQRATTPLTPYSPNRVLFSALGVMLGLVLGFGAALMIELLSRRIRTSVDLEQATAAPFLASIPQLTRNQLRIDGERVTPERFAILRPMSSYVEAFRTIRNSIVLSARIPPKTIAILSALPGEGKSTTSLSLARVMALSGDRVILVDCDLRRGRIGDMIETTSAGGLVEVLTGKATLAESVVKDSVSELDVLPLRSNSFTAVDLFSTDAMRTLVQTLRERYDFVIFDTAPILAVADSRIIASLSDAAVFVARADSTPPRAARLAVNLVRKDGTKIVGAALSMARLRAGRLSASDPAYYSAKYRQYRQA